MNSLLGIGLSGLKHYLAKLGNTAHNAANINTAGFKSARIDSKENIQGSRTSTAGSAGGAGVVSSGTTRNVTQGAPVQTGNPLDLALNGNGYFRLSAPDGETVYSRSGVFQRSPEGRIVTPDGLTLEPGIEIPADTETVTITPGGNVQADGRDTGRIELARFPNPGGLKPAGANRFSQTSASGNPVHGFAGEQGMGEIMQGFLESSNVDIIDTQAELIVNGRSFQANAQSVKAADDNLGTIINIRR